MFKMKFVILPSMFTTKNLSLAQQWVLRWRVSLWKLNLCVWQQLENYTSLCCVCTVTSVSHERTNCWVMPVSRQCILESECPVPAQGGDRATCDPYFKRTLCSPRHFCASWTAAWPWWECCSPVQPWAGSSCKCSGNGKGKVSPGRDTRQQLLLFRGWIVDGWALQKWGP